MGKATRWFRAILGMKKSDTPSSSSSSQSTSARSKEKRRWSFVKSYRERENHHLNYYHVHKATVKTDALYAPEAVTVQEYEKKEEEEANNHAIAVAEATAAVAEAAVAAAHAAAAVVRLTSSGRCPTDSRLVAYASGNLEVPTKFEAASAVKIQAVFRGYLARKALRALKGLVRLQALVRGHIERKRTADWLHRMQALMQAQARARAGRVLTVESSYSSSKSAHSYQPGPPTPEKFERLLRGKGTNCERPSLLKRNGSKSTGRVIADQDKPQSALSWSDQTDERLCEQRRSSTRSKSVDDENCDKILEMNNLKARLLSKRKNLFHSSSHIAAASEQYSRSFTASKDTTTHQTVQSSSSCEVQSLSPMKLPIHDVDEGEFCTAENSPQYLTASSRGGFSRSPFTTPTKSDASISYLSEFSDHPNYMSYTESSKAKVRSLSAPKQRPQYERSSSTKRYSIHGFVESRFGAQRTSAMQANFASKGYPGSGRLDRLGMPVGYKY